MGADVAVCSNHMSSAWIGIWQTSIGWPVLLMDRKIGDAYVAFATHCDIMSLTGHVTIRLVGEDSCIQPWL